MKRQPPAGRPALKGRANREMISIRLDPDVLARLRALAAEKGIGYQSLMNDLLAAHVARQTKAGAR